ncbi:MAG: WXG100 family type VII secretion target [Oscillospiraceae bacterium]|nr:WXG100 family type VII secretion target [Oscillospiraceae bacterium]
MALIEVNHSDLREVASAITKYCSAQKKEMNSVKSDIKDMLASGWKGPDAVGFGQKWDDVDSGDSTSVKFRESLKAFGEALDACAKEYESAQSKTYTAASWLPKYLVW